MVASEGMSVERTGRFMIFTAYVFRVVFSMPFTTVANAPQPSGASVKLMWYDSWMAASPWLGRPSLKACTHSP